MCASHRSQPYAFIGTLECSTFFTTTTTAIETNMYYWTDGIEEQWFQTEDEAQKYSEEKQIWNYQNGWFNKCVLNPFMGGRFVLLCREAEETK